MRMWAGLLAMTALVVGARSSAALDGHYYFQDFEDGNALKNQDWKGRLDHGKGYGGSKVSCKGDVGPDGKSFINVHDPRGGMFNLTKTTVMRAGVYVSTDTQLELRLHSRSKGYLRFSTFARALEWTLLNAPTKDFQNNQNFRNVVEGDVDEIRISTLSPAELWVDDLGIAASPSSVEGSVAALAERARTDKTAAAKLAERKAQTLDPASDFVYLSPDTVRYLKDKVWKKDQVTPKTVLNVGDDLAINYGFWKPIFGPRTAFDGYTTLDKTLCATAGATFDTLKGRFQKTLSEARPEVVVFSIGRIDLGMGRPERDVQAWFDFYVNSAIEAGAIPILVTPAYPNSGDPAVRDVYLKLATMTRAYAMNRRIPLVDCWLLVSDNPQWVAASGPNSQGLTEINKLNTLLYTKLDEWVFERRQKVVPPIDLDALVAAPTAPPIPGVGNPGTPPPAPKVPLAITTPEPPPPAQPGKPAVPPAPSQAELIKKKLEDTE